MARAKARAGLKRDVRCVAPPCWWAPAPASWPTGWMAGDHRHGFLAARSPQQPETGAAYQHVEFEKVINMARQLFKRRKFAASPPKASGNRLQERRSAERLHRRKRQDHPGPHHRHQGSLSASAVDRHQTRPFPGPDAVHRPALRFRSQATCKSFFWKKVANLGQLGDIVKVKDGYARNFLIPQGKAKRATEPT